MALRTYRFDEWVDDSPTGVILEVDATNHHNAIARIAGISMTFQPHGSDVWVPIVPIFCLTHGTVKFGHDILFQLRSIDGWPEMEPFH